MQPSTVNEQCLFVLTLALEIIRKEIPKLSVYFFASCHEMTPNILALTSAGRAGALPATGLNARSGVRLGADGSCQNTPVR